jgi:hypothetical protein
MRVPVAEPWAKQLSVAFPCLVVSRKTQREERPWFPLPDRFAIISPKSRWDILKHDEDSVRGNATSGSKKFGQLSAERVSFPHQECRCS